MRILEYSGGSLTSTKQFVWCAHNRTEERDSTGSVVKQMFDYGESISASNYFYSKDFLGSVREMTDDGEAVSAQYAFSPYGEVSTVSETVPADFGFAGYYRHERSKLSLNPYRSYNAALGRFMSRDPFLPGASNLYLYTRNDPMNSSDPLGLDSGEGYIIGPPAPIPDHPANADVDQNIQRACNHRNDVTKLIWFRKLVHNKAPWDYKQLGPQYQAFGNFNFGATAAAAGIPLNFALQQAGAAQIAAGTSQPEWQTPEGQPPYGDDPVDQMYIRDGYDYFMRHYDKDCKCKNQGTAV